MLAYILAIAIGLSSLILFGIAFFASTLHRKDDFLWSGVGLFYALILWLCASQIRGAVLLGHGAASILVISFGWQTLKLRQAIAHPEQQGELFSVMEWLQNRISSLFRRKKAVSPPPTSESATPTETVVKPPTEAETETTETLREAESQEKEIKSEEKEDTAMTTEVKEVVETTAPVVDKVPEEPAKATISSDKETKVKKGFSLKNLFGFGKGKTQDKPEQISQALDKIETDMDDVDGDWDNATKEQESPSTVSQDLTDDKQEEVAQTPISQENQGEIINQETSIPLETVTDTEENTDSEILETESLSSQESTANKNTEPNSISPSEELEEFAEELLADAEAETILESYPSNSEQVIGDNEAETVVKETTSSNESSVTAEIENQEPSISSENSEPEQEESPPQINLEKDENKTNK